MTPQMRGRAATKAAAVGLLCALGGCAATDPLLDRTAWRPTGANEANIAAQVVNPVDLVHGRQPVGGADGDMAAAAVQRLRTGHVKALPDSALSDLKVQAAPSSPGSP